MCKFSDLSLLALKFTKFFMSKLEEKLIFCFKNDKNEVNFNLSTQNSQNFYFDWFLFWKIYNVWLKKVQRSYLRWHWRVMQNLNKNWLVVWNVKWGIWQIFNRALEKFQNWNFHGILLSKVENVWASNLCVMCHDNEEWCKFWLENNFLQLTKTIHINHSKVFFLIL